MKKESRYVMALSALLLAALYFMPFWTISMTAPQYPEGIGMFIHINDVSGHNRHDIQSINTLNHYIGMKEIIADEIPEIRIMPWIFIFLILSGLMVAWLGDVRWVAAWAGLLLLLGAAGLVDYYMWGYDYGHNLNPEAPIQVPGMSYQPPLIGCKQLLNINACSLPAVGSLFLALPVLGAGWVMWKEDLLQKIRS